MPLITQVANKKKKFLSIFGNNYETRDGTAERDFIHVVDLAVGHVKSVEIIGELENFEILNLGTGKGTTVLELINSFAKVNNVSIPVRMTKPRFGDVVKSLADTTKAASLMDFSPKKSLNDMCVDSWNWEIKILMVIKNSTSK